VWAKEIEGVPLESGRRRRGAAGQTADYFDSGRQFNRIGQATWLEAFSRIRSSRLVGLKRRGGWD